MPPPDEAPLDEAPRDEALHDEPHCEECSRLRPRDARGWRVETGVDGAALVYCPDCWEREFGGVPGDASPEG